MELVPLPSVPTREQIEKLQISGSVFPQFEPVTEHYFSGGMYIRKAKLPANLLVVGKVHKHAHFFVLCEGEMSVWTEEGMKIIKSGDVICSGPGTKRALYCLTDCVAMNVHKTDNTDLVKIERELVEEDDSALFDAANLLKDRSLPCFSR